MIFELLRTYKVDVLRYLPRFLAKDESFKSTQDALSEEHEKLRQLIIELCKQMFVETATWGLDDWERVYGIETDKDLSLEKRRENLLIKIQGAQTVTTLQLEKLVNNVVPTNDATVIENTAPNQFKVVMESAVAVDEVRKVVEHYKPAHLTYVVGHLFKSNSKICVGGIVSVCTVSKVKYAASDKRISVSEGLYIGMSVMNTDIIKV